MIFVHQGDTNGTAASSSIITQHNLSWFAAQLKHVFRISNKSRRHKGYKCTPVSHGYHRGRDKIERAPIRMVHG